MITPAAALPFATRSIASAGPAPKAETEAVPTETVSISPGEAPGRSLGARILSGLGKTAAVFALAGALVGLGTLVPHETVARAPVAERPALQKHVDFFDRNGDGQTQVWETYGGLRALGVGRATSAFAAPVINGALAYKTGAPWYQPLTVQNGNIHQGKHDGDTDIYDATGNFVQANFDQMFDLHDKDKDGALNEKEVEAMLLVNGGGKANAGSNAEFTLLMKVAGEDRPDGRVLTRERMNQFYDGSLFYVLAGEKVPF